VLSRCFHGEPVPVIRERIQAKPSLALDAISS